MILNDSFVGMTLKEALIQLVATYPNALMSFRGTEYDVRDIPLEFVRWGGRNITREDRRPELTHFVTEDEDGHQDREWITVFHRQGA